MNNTDRIANYAKQQGVTLLEAVTDFSGKTIPDLKEIADVRGIPYTTKTRKGDLVRMLNESVQGTADVSKLTPRQQRRLRKKAHR